MHGLNSLGENMFYQRSDAPEARKVNRRRRLPASEGAAGSDLCGKCRRLVPRLRLVYQRFWHLVFYHHLPQWQNGSIRNASRAVYRDVSNDPCAPFRS